MAAELRLDPAAEADVHDVYLWYTDDRPGRAGRFLAEYERCLDSIAAAPRIHRAWYGRFRRINLRHFPYFVVYEFDGTLATVLAVRHSARDPRPLQEWLDDRDAS